LADPRGTNPVLRQFCQATIRNQAFEIAVLNRVEQQVARGVTPLFHIGSAQLVAVQRGWDGLEHEWTFVEAPEQSAMSLWVAGRDVTTSEYDVQFARLMTKHHKAAIAMARAYNTNPDGGNSIIGPLNVNIMTTQNFE